jgi:23S rRNA pseudouridine1911/1915/1917 synthase
MSKIRLYKYLVDTLKESSYTIPEIKRNIESHGVYVDDILINKQLHWVYGEQKIIIEHWPKRITGDTSKIKIIYEDQDCMVLFKPYGLIVEEGAGHKYDNVVHWLHNNYPQQNFQKFYNDKSLPLSGLAHRIDKNTQGLLIIAKSPKSLQFIQSQFKERTVSKKYLAVVSGIVENNFVIHTWQARSKSNPLKQRFFWNEKEALKQEPQSRNAISIIKPILICPDLNQSLVEVKIKTGRMHQIRVQCENLGFPLVADSVYNSPMKFDKDQFLINHDNKLITPVKPPRSISKDEFDKISLDVFGDHEYRLLSNQIKITLPSGKESSFVVVDLETLS